MRETVLTAGGGRKVTITTRDHGTEVLDAEGRVVAASQPLARALPVDEDEVRLPGADSAYLLVSEDADAGGASYDVVVAASLEDVAESTDALVAPLAVGLPLVLLLVGGTTWVVAGRALASSAIGR